MTPLTILVDLDAITADLLTKWLHVINTEFGETLTIRDIQTFHVADACRKEIRHKIYPIIERPGFYADLNLIPGAQDFLSQWKMLGHNVLFCSSPPTPWGAGEKYQWILDHFGELGFTRKDVILANKKHLIHGDVLIDDYPKNAAEYRAAWPRAHTITIGYPYNMDERGAYNFVAGSWQRPYDAWQQLDQYIQALAR